MKNNEEIKGNPTIPGQCLVLQFLSSLDSPRHARPPFMGGGFVQLLLRICVPPPQLTGHVDHGDQSVKPPSTMDEISSVYFYFFHAKIGMKLFLTYE